MPARDRRNVAGAQQDVQEIGERQAVDRPAPAGSRRPDQVVLRVPADARPVTGIAVSPRLAGNGRRSGGALTRAGRTTVVPSAGAAPTDRRGHQVKVDRQGRGVRRAAGAVTVRGVRQGRVVRQGRGVRRAAGAVTVRGVRQRRVVRQAPDALSSTSRATAMRVLRARDALRAPIRPTREFAEHP
jgi:hypothetical protein